MIMAQGREHNRKEKKNTVQYQKQNLLPNMELSKG